MNRYLERLLAAGVYSRLITLALHIAENVKRSKRQKVTFALSVGGFILIGLLALAGFAFVISQLLKYGGGEIGLVVALALLGVAGIWSVIIGLALVQSYRRAKA
ncbi:MAG: hypothetical protein LKJ29_07595 [Lactobacillus sp.]|mgnify:CR=1 FL=1|uniref:hypothetical protein n=1 Tax=Lacticaseibacillus suilingensis TaxID=2799577 RepID=UPI0022E929BF|nr:hypothetical protein [Lacticaseibacillus suilingensis]MCI1893939.1 hypothetical protein [Lactobacillus sp.]MCI1941901.1 hypothetical protein [Lactobacillus sp.]MCI1972831.1 hypothetical protein [Lactobacillus sp.]MCI2017564.1 hypothetical protein [Lactobacillus sp.]MCI2038220.1 hypothetical protein [Lactobacillus sp.]